MKDLKLFSVDDGVASGFCYQAGKSIAIDFDGCYSLESGRYLNEPCSFIIKDWVSATATHVNADGSGKELPLERVLGIIDMVLSVESEDGLLELWVETIDGRYLLLKFKGAIAGFVFANIK